MVKLLKQKIVESKNNSISKNVKEIIIPNQNDDEIFEKIKLEKFENIKKKRLE